MIKPTLGDYRMFAHYFDMYGSITRWGDWENKKELFRAHHPEVVDAIERLESVGKTLSIVAENMLDNVEGL